MAAATIEREAARAPAPATNPTVRVMTVLPETAATWLATDLYERQRPLRDWHINRLAVAIAKREFKPGTIEFAVVGDQRFLVDGQHRLHAVIKAEKAVPGFVIAEYHYETLEEVEAHYGRTDVGVKRTLLDAPLLMALREELDLSGSEWKFTLAGLNMIRIGFDTRKRDKGTYDSAEQRAMLANTFRSEIGDYWKIVRAGRAHMNAHLLRGGTCSVGFVTLRYKRERAKLFWERVAHNVGYEENSGEYHLVAYFLSKTGRENPAITARVAARAFSLAQAEEIQSRMNTPNPDVPLRIDGTPYDGKTVRTF